MPENDYVVRVLKSDIYPPVRTAYPTREIPQLVKALEMEPIPFMRVRNGVQWYRLGSHQNHGEWAFIPQYVHFEDANGEVLTHSDIDELGAVYAVETE